ncbi:hypothetical protein GALL_526090 [mine drainage metagenome]|uniref:Uncharacterized protein n=1 Tax=mine drainage metagenome TaxID=410659 RepID=A0A1J5PE77_9ZZZZ
MSVALVELSVAEPAKAWAAPLARVTLPEGVVIEAVTVFGGVTVPFQLLTRALTSGVPRPETSSQPVAAVKPVRPGTLLLPDLMSWKTAGPPLAYWALPRLYNFVLALPCRPYFWTTRAITPAKEGDAADVPPVVAMAPWE